MWAVETDQEIFTRLEHKMESRMKELINNRDLNQPKLTQINSMWTLWEYRILYTDVYLPYISIQDITSYS